MGKCYQQVPQRPISTRIGSGPPLPDRLGWNAEQPGHLAIARVRSRPLGCKIDVRISGERGRSNWSAGPAGASNREAWAASAATPRPGCTGRVVASFSRRLVSASSLAAASIKRRRHRALPAVLASRDLGRQQGHRPRHRRPRPWRSIRRCRRLVAQRSARPTRRDMVGIAVGERRQDQLRAVSRLAASQGGFVRK